MSTRTEPDLAQKLFRKYSKLGGGLMPVCLELSHALKHIEKVNDRNFRQRASIAKAFATEPKSKMGKLFNKIYKPKIPVE